jgi:ribosomal protein S27AE
MASDTIRVFTKKCPVCGGMATHDLDRAAYLRWKKGELIQNCFPTFTADEQERFISGLHGECFKTYLGTGTNSGKKGGLNE